MRLIAELDGSMLAGVVRTRTEARAMMRELDDGTVGPLPARADRRAHRPVGGAVTFQFPFVFEPQQ